MSNSGGAEDVVGALVRDRVVIAREVAARLRDEGGKRRASFLAPKGLIRPDDLLHLVIPGEPARVVALHVNRRIRRQPGVDGDPIDARVMGDSLA